MSLRDRWRHWQAWRAKRYLSAHPDLAMGVLRRNEDLAIATLEASYTRHGYQAPDASTLLRFDLEAQGRAPQRDTAPYPSLTNMGFGGSRPLQRTLPKLSSWNLRRFSEIPPARRAINAITNPILDMPWVIQARPQRGVKSQPLVEPTADQSARIAAATAMLERPNNEQTWREMLEMAIEDMCALGAASIEVQRNTSDERPYFLWPVDTQSIRINVQWKPGDRTFRYSQARGVFYSAMGTTDDIRLSDDELMYIRLNPRTSSPFGYGYLEVAFETVNAFIGAMDYATRRASNSTPSFAIFLGENTTPDQVRRFQHYWQNEVEGYGSVPLLGGGKSPSVLHMGGAGEDPLWLKWQEWLTRVVAMSFGISPMRLGLERDINRSTAEAQTAGDWETVAPVANAIKDYITHWLLWRRLGWTDLEFGWQVKIADELQLASVIEKQWNSDNITVDEMREVYERPPVEDGLGRLTKTAYIAAIQGAVAQRELSQEQEHEERMAKQAPKVVPRQVSSAEDDDADAWLRALVREQRELAAVAT